MKNNSNFEVFLFFSPKKIILSVNRKTDFELIFKDEFLFENNSTQLNFDQLESFLNENIFKIEKILENFIEKINIIIETTDFKQLQKLEKEGNFNEYKNREKGFNFFYKGPENNWKEILKKNVSNEIEINFEKEMKKLSYL